ncbi:MAG: tRNA (adenosine(37)-N6)-dimethylallyltransferase MiaA [Lachnospiraceae bacterium]|nr:tRNA (adenosine(37)-N6)-dimethylallyltransferase MiaA [Lachnospiraceae bacterium]
MKPPLIILTGPTAVGKTKLSLALAKAVNGEIISADSMQVYKRMTIGTAKILPEEMQGVPHHLIDILEPSEEFNVVLFAKYAKEAIKKCYKNGKIPILVGGTGFYIQAVLYDIDFTENDDDKSYREELERIAQEEGAEVLHKRLQEVDAKAAKEIHPNNVKRVIRALEFYEKSGGQRISDHNEEQKQKESPYNYAYFVLNDERSTVYERIDKRVDIMLEQGLVEEVKALLTEGVSPAAVSMQGLGYKEMVAYLHGECTLEEAVYVLKRDTRHFAKRQITWFKREDDVIWINRPDFEEKDEKILGMMLNILKEKEITK